MADAVQRAGVAKRAVVAACALAAALACAPLFAASSVTLSEALAMARSALAIVQATGELPEQMEVPLPRSGAVRMKADAALLFFCSALLHLHARGKASDRIDLPAGCTRLRRAPKLPDGKAREATARVQTAALVRQCQALLSVAKRAGGLPSAIWVADQRLSAAQFFGAVLTALSAAKEGQGLPEQVAAPAWQGPRSWPACPPFEAPGGVKTGAAASKLISINPDGSAPLSGAVSVTISYKGKLGYLEVLLDGKQRWMGNSSPFSFVWKTDTVQDGEHTLIVRAVDKDGTEARLERTFTVKNSS